MAVKALDVSNWGGYCDFHEARALGYRHVIVRLSSERPGKRDIAIQQLQAAQEAGMTTSGYSWPYFDQDPAEFADRCMQIAVDAGTPLKYVWLDLEGAAPPSNMFAWAWEFYRGVGADQPCGIYTGPGWWLKYGQPAATLREGRRVPLWLAHYDGIAKLRDEYMPLYPWRALAAKQYQGTTTVAGVSADLNVVGKRYV